MKSICVFCGSNLGNSVHFSEGARALGKRLAEEGITLIYGGANIGLMGTIADAALKSGGRVIGVLPRFLQDKEIAHAGLSELILCETMHERKTRMFELAQGFIAMPGGFGTLEEIIEILTWQQLGLHKYPVGFLNIDGFFHSLQNFFDQMENVSLLKPENKKMALFADTVEGLLQSMKSYRAPEVSKWISKSVIT
ncbi:MAG: TIGR00730 family Rossman fold protein [Bdellovibrionales bacterium]|nr:TIGR00730 family Rossman fold protein [Bdellovibrionales bacterium]